MLKQEIVQEGYSYRHMPQELLTGVFGQTQQSEKIRVNTDAYTTKTAQMICFQIINQNIMNNDYHNFACAIRFAHSYPQLTEEIAATHPEYFINVRIAKLCITDAQLLNSVIAHLSYNANSENNSQLTLRQDEYYEIKTIGDNTDICICKIS